MWTRLFLIALALSPAMGEYKNYYAKVWCNYKGDFMTECRNVETELTTLVNTRLQAVYGNYPSSISAPGKWARYDEKNNRRSLRGEMEEDPQQETRDLGNICPLSNCMAGGYTAQQCSYYCPNGRRLEESLEGMMNELRQLDTDYSASLTASLQSAATQAYQAEVKTSILASNTCKTILSEAVCYASVTTD